MSWLKCFGLIVTDNNFISLILDDFVRNNDFEIDWINWCVGCKDIVKNPCWKFGQYGIEVKNAKISVWSFNLKKKYNFNLYKLGNLDSMVILVFHIGLTNNWDLLVNNYQVLCFISFWIIFRETVWFFGFWEKE